MLQACVNGGLTKAAHPGVPETPDELARDAIAVHAAGARELHLHPRDENGAETLAPDVVAATLRAVRAAVPDLPLGIGTGAWIAPGGRDRQRHIADWHLRPDYASVNLHEADALDVMALLTELGVGIEAGLWRLADAERFLAQTAPDACLRILVEMDGLDADTALPEATRVLDALAEAQVSRPVLLHGDGAGAWTCVHEAARRGLDTRIGFEDTRHLPDGSLAPDNAALVRAAAEVPETSPPTSRSASPARPGSRGSGGR